MEINTNLKKGVYYWLPASLSINIRAFARMSLSPPIHGFSTNKYAEALGAP